MYDERGAAERGGRNTNRHHGVQSIRVVGDRTNDEVAARGFIVDEVLFRAWFRSPRYTTTAAAYDHRLAVFIFFVVRFACTSSVNSLNSSWDSLMSASVACCSGRPEAKEQKIFVRCSIVGSRDHWRNTS